MRSLRGALVLAILPLALACGDDATAGDDTTTTTATSSGPTTTNASMTSVASEGSTTAADGSTTAADGSSDDAPACPPFPDDASPGPITIDVVNLRPEGVWLPLSPGCISPVPYSLVDPAGAEVDWRGPVCGTCQGAAQGDCPCPPPACDEATGLYLEAGASIQYAWYGLRYVSETIPAACPGIEQCGEACQRAEVAAPGTYTLTVQAGGATGCAVEPCACTPADGSCTLYDAGMAFTMLGDYGGTLDLPGDASVTISID
ncbi:MAG: hypothetical protein H6712_06465 [Myxococcales bacterium]|nr:hypothetical protein [Myxococcales bacterium]MCB9713478.1 hypothetical protein [Myxococcales bacterium]